MNIELIKSQQKYEQLVHSIDGVVWEAETTKLTFISKQAERFFGYPLEEWLNQPTFWYEHIHPDDKAQAIAYCEECVTTGKDHDLEYRMTTADNRTIWIRNLVTVENEKTVKLYGVMFDITKQKETEEQLKEKNHALETFNKLAVNREFRVIALKKEINQLLTEAGKQIRYKIPT